MTDGGSPPHLDSVWRAGDREIVFGSRSLVMGVINVTPDSFSDGGENYNLTHAIGSASAMIEDGVDILDIGGESTRPGAPTVPAEEEARRVLPVIRQLSRILPANVAISVDTCKPQMAEAALGEGAHIVNDICALGSSPLMAQVVKRHRAGLILMHMQGTPATMQINPVYGSVVDDIERFLSERIEYACTQGIERSSIAIDPGIGFGKTLEHNLAILARLQRLQKLGCPVLVGPSRKAFLGKLTGEQDPRRREEATIAACCVAVMNGANIVRVHNVRGARQALLVVDAIRAAKGQI